jgi:(2Fe-2S) ferredoxin
MSTCEGLPVIYRYHAICCFQQRPPGHPKGSCAGHGAGPLWEYLSASLTMRPIDGVMLTPAGCLGFCEAGPLMVVYPQGVWYQPKTKADIDEIVQKHFIEGELVERLAVILER